MSPWVRVTHLPTGLQADCHHRVSFSNPDGPRATALRLLRARLWSCNHGVSELTELAVLRDYPPAPDPATSNARKEDAAALARALDSTLRARLAESRAG